MTEVSKEENFFDVQIFKEHIRNKLVDLFDSIPGQKDLYMDKSIIGLFNLSIDIQEMHSIVKNIGIINENVILKFQIIQSESKKIIFFASPQIETMKKIANIIQHFRNKKIDREFHLVFTPRRTNICKQVLEKEFLYDELEIRDFNFDLIPLENDLLSLEMDYFFKDYYLGRDLSLAQYVSDSIERFQSVFGAFPKIFGKGQSAQIVVDNLNSRKIQGTNYEDAQGDLDSLIIFDRNIGIIQIIDFITPLMTQQTYKGLIDEIFQIKDNITKIDPKILNKQGDNQNLINYSINPNTDFCLLEIQDKNLPVVGEFLGEKFSKFKEIIESKNQKRSPEEMSQYMKKFIAAQNEQAYFSTHINIADKLKEEQMKINFLKNQKMEWDIIVGGETQQAVNHLEIQSALQNPIESVLRIFGILSQTDNNLKSKQVESIKTEIIHNYGFENLLLLNNLESIGILRKLTIKSNWNQLSYKKNLNLTNIDVDQNNPDDSSFAYAGYTPIMTRLFEHSIQNNWKSITSSLALLNGPTIIEQQISQTSNKRSLIMIYVIGGVTYGEIATFRFIAKKYDKKIVICSTQIINGNKIINQCKEI